MAGIVKTVEKVTITLDNASEPVTQNLSKGQDETQCVPWHSAYWAENPNVKSSDRITYKIQLINNAGTAAVKVIADLRTDTEDQIIEIFVVEFDSTINVQQIAVTDFDDAVATKNVTITSVGAAISEAFIIYSHDMGTGMIAGEEGDWDNHSVEASLTTPTNVELSRQNTGSDGDANGFLYVVDCDSAEFIVEHKNFSRGTNTDLVHEETISATVLADTFLIHSFESNANDPDIEDNSWIVDLKDTTTLRFRRSLTGDTVTSTVSRHHVQVVECQNSEWDVQREAALTLASASQTDSITAIDQARALVCGGHGMGGGNMSVPRDDSTVDQDLSIQMCAYDFSANDTVRVRRNGGPTDAITAYEVVQFVLSVGDIVIPVPTGPEF